MAVFEPLVGMPRASIDPVVDAFVRQVHLGRLARTSHRILFARSLLWQCLLSQGNGMSFVGPDFERNAGFLAGNFSQMQRAAFKGRCQCCYASAQTNGTCPPHLEASHGDNKTGESMLSTQYCLCRDTCSHVVCMLCVADATLPSIA